MKTFTVRLNGYPIKEFKDELQAKRFAIDIQIQQKEIIKQMVYIDEAVMKSDLSEAKEVIQKIMEMK